MGDAQSDLTANIVDTGIFWGLGRPPNDDFDAFRTAVVEADATLLLPRPIYDELGGNTGADTYPSGSAYVDAGIEEGWIRVAELIENHPKVETAIEDAKTVLKNKSNHPKTTCVDQDAKIIGLAAQKFVRMDSIYVIIHTNDRAVADAAVIALHEQGFMDVDARFTPPQAVKDTLNDPEMFLASRR